MLVVLLVSLGVGCLSCLANIPLQALALDVTVLQQLDRLLSLRWYQTLLRKHLHQHSEAAEAASPSPHYKQQFQAKTPDA